MSNRTHVGGSVTRHNSHHQTFAAIKDWKVQNSCAPTVEELTNLTGRSESTIQRHLLNLIDEGLITRKLYQARGIELTGLEIENLPSIQPDSVPARYQPRCIPRKVKRLPVKINDGGLPKLTKAELERNINRVVAKAKAREAAELHPNEDVVRGSFGHRQLRHLYAIKVG